MISDQQINARLLEWGREFRSGKYEHVGWHSKNILQVCHEHKGFKPDNSRRPRIAINTPADEVEAAVILLQKTPGKPKRPNPHFRAAMCLRACYVAPEYWPESERLSQLKRIGIWINRVTYYEALKMGRLYVSGFLDRQWAA